MSNAQPPSTGRFHFVTSGRACGTATGSRTRSPYGLEIIESCLTCPERQDRLFCNLPPEALQRLSEITALATYPKGATLFVEGQASRGIFVLCTGRVKLLTSSADRKTLILRISEPGDLLGLAAAISGRPYEVGAEVIEPAQANFIGRTDLLNFLREYGDAALRVAQELSESYHAAFGEMRTIGLSHSAGEKLARFILEWSANHAPEDDSLKFALALTHEEIAQMIGTSRETVTRLFAEFKKKNLLQTNGSTVTIKDKLGLERRGPKPIVSVPPLPGSERSQIMIVGEA